LLAQPTSEIPGVAARADVLARLGQDRARRVDRQGIVDATRQFVHGRQVPELHLSLSLENSTTVVLASLSG
jgi:hypothetical protein